MSTRPVVFNLINCIIGVSVLAMPFCFQECGIMLCGVAIISSSWLTKKSCELLLKAGQIARRRNYEGLALSTYGAPGKLAVETSIIGLLIGTLIAFNVIIGDLVPSIFNNLSGVEVSWTVRAVLMTVLAFGVGLPLSMMRNLHSLSSFSALSLLFYMGFVLQIFLTALPKIVEGSWIFELNYWRPEKLLQYLPIFALAFACQTQLFALYDTLPEPSVKKMEGVVSTGINIVGLVYFLVGLFGYICFHNAGVKGDMLNNYGNTFISHIIKLGFVMSVVVSFPLMVYPLRASLHSLIFQQSHNSENLPGGAGFIPQERFTYLTLAIISGTLTLGILFPQIEFVLALTGATMGTLIAFVFPSSMFLHVVTEKTHLRLVAKLVLVLGLICFVAGTYTVLMTQESAEHGHQVDIHPPGVDPIKPMAVHDSIQKHVALRDAVQEDNSTKIHVKGGPVDIDVAKIGLQGGNALKEDVANDAKPGEVKPVEVKPIEAVANEGLNLKAVEPAQPDEDEGKRQEPPVPHAPQNKPAKNAPDEQHGDKEHLNEKRQLMSNAEKEKLLKAALQENKVDDAVAARNIADSNQVKVSAQEIDAELKNLQQPDKVSSDASLRQTAEKDTAQVDPGLNEAKPEQDTPEKSLVKRDVRDLANGDYKLEESDKRDRTAREHIGVSKMSENQTHPVEKDVLQRKQLSHSSQLSRDGRTSLESNNKTAAIEDRHEVENGIKIRDLKSNRKLKVKHVVASKSFRTFLSKQNLRKSRRSNLQGESR